MKVSRRGGISQSMDLFIIVAAVLGVGGVVSASIYNLVTSATTDTSVAVVEVSLRAGSAAPAAWSVERPGETLLPKECRIPWTKVTPNARRRGDT